ncbi:MAG: nucleotidyl transferase AbiEii/AbiGii toxin family protein [Pseudomonadota bacterium]
MSQHKGKDLAASVRARLLNLAKVEQSDFNGVLVRYALERLLYRLSRSAHADRYLLKGAMLFTLWYDMPHRPTRDVDLLGFGPCDLESVRQTFREIASVAVEDGIEFDPASVSAQDIRKEGGYGGARVFIAGELAGARLKTQVDVGFGDAVTPGPVPAVFPVMLDDFPAPKLQTYPVYTVIAEKLHAITLLGMTNTRLKDYVDLSVLLERETLDMAILAKAIAATFGRRGTPLPDALPIGLSEEFALDLSRMRLWQAFLNKNQLMVAPLQDVVAALRSHLQPALRQAQSVAGPA